MVKIPRRGAAQPTNNTPSTRQSQAKSTASAGETPTGRLKQIGMVAGLIRKSDPRALPITIGSGVGVLVVLVVVGLLTNQAPLLIPLGVLLGLVTTMILFGRYAQSAQYSAIEGQPGAAAAVIQSMRGNWSITPAIAGNRNMDIVRRVVGPPGVVLVGEANGQVPIKQLQRKLRTLPRELKPHAISELNSRLKTLPSTLQAPRGPMPQRGGRMPKPPRPKVR